MYSNAWSTQLNMINIQPHLMPIQITQLARAWFMQYVVSDYKGLLRQTRHQCDYGTTPYMQAFDPGQAMGRRCPMPAQCKTSIKTCWQLALRQPGSVCGNFYVGTSSLLTGETHKFVCLGKV